MDKSKDKNYVKKIIEEYHIFLAAWGHSDHWNQSQFKTLEDMIYESTKVQVNSNTLRRFFQHKTGNPQLATKEALCKFLGYSGYTDFVLKMTEAEKKIEKTDFPETVEIHRSEENHIPEKEYTVPSRYDDKTEVDIEKVASGVKRNQKHIYLITVFVALLFLYFLSTFVIKDWCTQYQVSKIEFTASKTKGTVPLTVTFSYTIPAALFDDISIVYEEANGDVTEKKLNKDANNVNATYIYEGEAYCYLKYKGETVRTLPVTTLRPGWSVYVREEKMRFFQTLPIRDAYTGEGYISLPFEKVPEKARASHLFVSYVFYRENLVDGDNFIFEARMRNSEEEHAIPLSDIIMYISSDTYEHGFAMNENGYAYVKFISGENSIKGDEHDLSNFNFNSSEWHIMKIKVADKKTTFYVDDEEILNMSYNKSLGMADELILRFKGCGAVDYVRVSDLNGGIVYQETFDGVII